MVLNKNINIIDNERKTHSKASEEYIHVNFKYDNGYILDTWIPVVYRRTGLDLSKNSLEETEYLNKVYEELNPINLDSWKDAQEEFWKTKPKANVTKSFFDALADGGWKCVNCELPSNPNWARRIQDLKEFGYTIATDTNRYCEKCNENKTHLYLLPIKRQGIDGNGYEIWSPNLRKRILNVLGNIDVYENKKKLHSLPDHKFSEIRWDQYTKSENPDNMTDAQIREKFQLLSNQRNQQKREICRNCFQTGQRGNIYGIKFYYEGTEKWDTNIPEKGKDAEKGCIGCPWYDIEKWRKELQRYIDRFDKKNIMR